MSYQSGNQYQTTSSLAVVSLVAGIASFFLPVLGSVIAIITGGMAKKEILNSDGTITGMGMAKAGLILGWITVGLGLITLCVILLITFGLVKVAMPVCLYPFTDFFEQMQNYYPSSGY